MEPFTVHRGSAVPLRRSNVDTDQIIPAAYLKRVTRRGFADGLCRAWRDRDPSFVLNDPRYRSATILVAGTDFGIGSSRQHAVWALRDWGFRAVIAPRFGDIFATNALKEGLLPVELPQPAVEQLWALAESDHTARVTVDLDCRRVGVDGASWPFPIDDFSRWRLMEGLDDIALTLRAEKEIAVYERGRPAFMPSVR